MKRRQVERELAELERWGRVEPQLRRRIWILSLLHRRQVILVPFDDPVPPGYVSGYRPWWVEGDSPEERERKSIALGLGGQTFGWTVDREP